MLKKIQFTFTVDPKDLALLLAFAGKLDVSLLADQPPKAAQLTLPKPLKPTARVLTFASNIKQFTAAQACKELAISSTTCVNAVQYLCKIKKLKRLAKGVYARA